MSKLNELIQEFCPDGVVYKKVADIAVVGTGKSDKKDATPDGEYPFYVRSKIIAKINTYEFDEEAIVIPGEGGVGEIFHYVTGKYALHQRAYRIHFVDSKVIPKFAYYHFMAHFKVFIMKKAVSATVTSIRKPMITDFPVPVPPLEVQKEIISILDKFTQFEADLSAELSAELDARRKQYEYYRKQLLTNDESQEGARKLTLGDVGKVSMCKRIFKDQTASVGDIPFYKIGTFGKAPDSFISQEVYDEYRRKYSFPKKGDILLSASGTIGRTVVYDGEDAYFQDSNIIWLDNDEKIITNQFLFHVYKIVKWQTEGGTIQRLYNDNLKKIKITVPSIDEQNRIVSLLNKFETLANDITEVLPAEISARRKQYEYYRAKLLAFQELSV